MDCLEGMKQIPDGTIDAVICDLPYGTTACAWDSVIPFDKLWEQYKRVRKPNAPIVLFCIEPFTSNLVCSNIKEYREKLTWEKHKPSNIGNAKYMHLKYSEDIVVFAEGRCTYNPQMQPRISDRVRQAQKGNSKQWRTNRKETGKVSFATQYEPRDWNTFDADWKYPGNVIRIPAVVSNSKEKCDHPTQKPIALLSYLIKTYTNEGDTVLDNCSGSGTTAIACIKEKRHFICFEKDETYWKKSVERVKNEQRQLSLL
jgi:site-specific DNA-methyltransferase (adenine-specific)